MRTGINISFNGSFIYPLVHLISFGVGSILKKAVVAGDEIKIREILNMTVLVNHAALNGAQMVRFLNGLPG